MADFSTHTIVLNGKHQQLIDLNKDKVNFISDFTITPNILDLDKDYYATVITQTQLDNDTEFDFKKLSGIHTGSIKNETNQYQNYFLAIKSTTAFREMKIENNLTELETEKLQEKFQERDTPLIEQDQAHVQVKESPPKENSNNKLYKYIIALFIVIVGCYLLYYFWKKSKNSTKSNTRIVPESNNTRDSILRNSESNVSFRNSESNVRSRNLQSNVRSESNVPSRNLDSNVRSESNVRSRNLESRPRENFNFRNSARTDLPLRSAPVQSRFQSNIFKPSSPATSSSASSVGSPKFSFEKF
jgi:hypothetical protein